MIDDSEAESRRIGARVRNRREAIGMAGADLARAIGLDPALWPALEASGGFTSVELIGVARMLDVPPAELLDADRRDRRVADAQAAETAMRRIDDPRLRQAALSLLDQFAAIR